MHILLIHQAFVALDEAGGTRHYEIAANLVGKGHHVTIIASPVSYLTGKDDKKTPSKQVVDGITIFRTYTYPALHKSFIHRVISFLSFMISSFVKSIQVHNIDLVWGTSPPIFQAISAWLIARLKGVPFLLEVRDLWPAFAIQVGVLKNPLLIKLSLWLEGFLYRHADLVVVNSPGYLDHVKNKGAFNIELIPNGSDATMFDPNSHGNSFRTRNQVDGKFLVVYAGAHGLSNDLGVILKAASKLMDETRIHFIFIGDGKEKYDLVARARQMNLKNVTFIDPVSKKEMAEVLAAANACIAILKPLELYQTTYPNKVFDYMAAGRPILLAIDGVMRKVVESAQCGVFVAPGDAQDLEKKVLWMLYHSNEVEKMGINGRDYLEKHFNRSQLSDKFIIAIEKLIKNYG